MALEITMRDKVKLCRSIIVASANVARGVDRATVQAAVDAVMALPERQLLDKLPYATREEILRALGEQAT